MTICKRCMAQYDEKYGVCPRCGEPFVPQLNLAQSNQTVDKKSKNPLIAIISISGIILVGIVIALIMIFSQPKTNSELSEQISLGEKYLTEENYDEAIVAFKKAIQIDPNDPQLYIQLADAYIGKGDKDSAVETLENGYKTTGSEEIKKKLDGLNSNTKESTSSETSKTQDNSSSDSTQKIKKDWDNYVKIYNELISSGSWRTYDTNIGRIGRVENNTRLEVKNSEIFDFDGDGVPEMLLYAVNPNSSPTIESKSYFYVIENNKPKIIFSGYETGGTMRGSAVQIRYDRERNKYVVGIFCVIGGFGGNDDSAEWYDYSKGKLNEVTKYRCIEYNSSNTDENEYKINGANVSKSDITDIRNRFTMVDYSSLTKIFDSQDNDDVESVLYPDKIQKYNNQVYYLKSINIRHCTYDFSVCDNLNYKTLPISNAMSFVIYNNYIYYCEVRDDYIENRNCNLKRCDLNGKNTIIIAENIYDDKFMIENDDLIFATGTYQNYIIKSYDIKTKQIKSTSKYSDIHDIGTYESKIDYGKVFDNGYYYSFYPNKHSDGSIDYFDERLYRRDNTTGKVCEVGEIYHQQA